MENELSSTEGLHLVVDILGCNKAVLGSLDAMHNLLLELAKLSGMRPITRPYVFHYDGEGNADEAGITGFVVIAESHISVHTYSAKGTAYLDLFSCRAFDSNPALLAIRRILVPQQLKLVKITRGNWNSGPVVSGPFDA